MTVGMDCRRAQELLSDHLEGALPEVLAADLVGHLDSCEPCRELREALGEVVVALRGYPLLEAPPGLAERAVSSALARRAVATPRRTRLRGWIRPAWVRLAAAALILSSGILLASAGHPARAATRLMDRTVSFGMYVVERTERLVEDLRVLKVMISTAFEGRVERMNDRLQDYRRLLDRRRSGDPPPKQGRGEEHGGPRTARFGPSFPNSRGVPSVQADVGPEALAGGPGAEGCTS